MSLICGEHANSIYDHALIPTDEVYAVTTESAPMYDAVCAKVIQVIPADLISHERLEGGLDIHLAYSVRNELPMFDMNLSIRHLTLHDYKCSISAETARQYLPVMSAKYLQASTASSDSER